MSDCQRTGQIFCASPLTRLNCSNISAKAPPQTLSYISAIFTSHMKKGPPRGTWTWSHTGVWSRGSWYQNNYSCLHALREEARTVLVKTVDSDVVVILITHFNLFERLSQECEVYVSFGSGKHNRILNIREMSLALGAQRCTALPLWVALTGCDSTSSMRGRSKRMAL